MFSTSAPAQETATGTATAATSQNAPPQLQPGWGFGGLPVDWSFKHVIHTAHSSKSQIDRMQNEPRAYYQWLVQGHKPGAGQASATLATAAATSRPAAKPAPGKRPVKPHRDWSLSLGSGTVAQNMFPAKFNFNINSTPDCTNDFVVYGLNVASSATQANLVGVNKLYSGTTPTTGICGTTPAVNWAYRASTAGGKITTSPILSLDGTKVAFVESTGTQSILHVLAWKATNGTVASPIVPTTVTSVVGCTTPCISSLTYDGTHGTTLSSPFYNYQASTDTLWIGNDNGQLFQITGVFLGTPIVSTSGGWSASGVAVAAAGVKMTAPVLDSNSGNIFIGGSDGNLYSVSSTNPATQSHIAVGSGAANGGGIVDPPTIDGSSNTVLAYAAANAANVGGTSLAANSTAVVVQATTALGSPKAATIGEGSLSTTANLNVAAGSFDNNYFNWSGSGANIGHFYAIGTAVGATSPTLYQIPYSGVASVAVNTPGAGYTTPAVTFSGGGGSGATATASGGVTGVALTAAGSGYTSLPTVSFSAPPSGTTASGSAPSVGVTALTPSSTGTGYTSVPAVAFSGTGSGASGTAFLGVVSYSIGTNTGTFNTSNATTAQVPSIAVGAPTGTGNPTTPATATATYNLAGVSLGSAAGSRCVGGTYNISGGAGTADTISVTTAGASNAISAVSFTGNGRVYSSGNAPSSPTVCPGTVNIASATSPGSVGNNKATVTASTAHGFATGDSVTIAGVTCGGGSCSPTFNGTWTITVTSSTQFTFTQCVFCFGDTADSNTGTVTDSNATQPNFSWQLKLASPVSVNAQGSGYTAVPTVSFTTPGPTGTVQVTPSLGVNSATVGAAGSYTTFPSASTSGGGGSGTVFTITAKATGVSVPTTAGSGYTTAPSITFSGGGGSGAAASSTINVTNVAVTFGGGGYSTAPAVTISGGSTNATATATINPGTVMTAGTPTTTAVVNATAAVQASPITEIFTNASTDLLFYGYGLAGSVGDIAAQNVTGSISAPTLVAEPNATGGTSGIVVDNISASAQASSIYFSTLATSNNCGTGVFCAVKLTQSGLQ